PIQDITPLASLPNLDSLNVTESQITSLDGISPRWTSLKAAHTSITSLEPLENMHELGFLDVSGTRITDFSPLAKLTNLQVLRVAQSAFSDLSLLLNLNKLTSLDISSTQVRDLTPLQHLPHLHELTASGLGDIDYSLLDCLPTRNVYVYGYERHSPTHKSDDPTQPRNDACPALPRED